MRVEPYHYGGLSTKVVSKLTEVNKYGNNEFTIEEIGPYGPDSKFSLKFKGKEIVCGEEQLIEGWLQGWLFREDQAHEPQEAIKVAKAAVQFAGGDPTGLIEKQIKLMDEYIDRAYSIGRYLKELKREVLGVTKE